MQEYGISARLTFSNSLLRQEHLLDKKCNALCEVFAKKGQNGVIVHSDLLLEYLKINYPELYFVSSTTKVLTDFQLFMKEVNREDFSLCRTGFFVSISLLINGKFCPRARKTRWNFYVMNAAGLAVQTEKAVMRL